MNRQQTRRTSACRRGVLLGYYGYQNFGDDLFLYFLTKTVLPVLSKRYSITVPIGGRGTVPEEVSLLASEGRNCSLEKLSFGSRFQRSISKARLSLLMAKSDLVVRGGGTFLYEQTGIKNLRANRFLLSLAKTLKKAKIIGLGIGVDPFTDPSMREIAHGIVDRFDFMIFRDAFSQSNAVDIVGDGILRKSIVLPDLAYGLTSEFSELRNEREKRNSFTKIGVNLTYPVEYSLDRTDIELIRGFISRLVDKGFEVCFVTAQGCGSKELELFRLIQPFFPNIRSISYSGNIHGFLGEVAGLDLLICSKFHLCVAAHILGIPFLAMEYQKKVGQLMKEIGSGENVFSYRDWDLIYARIVSNNLPLPKIPALELERRLAGGLLNTIDRVL